MTVMEEIRGLSKPDALRAMEALWSRLGEFGDEPESPDWHREELDRREALIARGEATFSDWDDAKERIRARVR